MKVMKGSFIKLTLPLASLSLPSLAKSELSTDIDGVHLAMSRNMHGALTDVKALFLRLFDTMPANDEGPHNLIEHDKIKQIWWVHGRGDGVHWCVDLLVFLKSLPSLS
jgi:hypothetical protein